MYLGDELDDLEMASACIRSTPFHLFTCHMNARPVSAWLPRSGSAEDGKMTLSKDTDQTVHMSENSEQRTDFFVPRKKRTPLWKCLKNIRERKVHPSSGDHQLESDADKENLKVSSDSLKQHGKGRTDSVSGDNSDNSQVKKKDQEAVLNPSGPSTKSGTRPDKKKKSVHLTKITPEKNIPVANIKLSTQVSNGIETERDASAENDTCIIPEFFIRVLLEEDDLGAEKSQRGVNQTEGSPDKEWSKKVFTNSKTDKTTNFLKKVFGKKTSQSVPCEAEPQKPKPSPSFREFFSKKVRAAKDRIYSNCPFDYAFLRIHTGPVMSSIIWWSVAHLLL